MKRGSSGVKRSSGSSSTSSGRWSSKTDAGKRR